MNGQPAQRGLIRCQVMKKESILASTLDIIDVKYWGGRKAQYLRNCPPRSASSFFCRSFLLIWFCCCLSACAEEGLVGGGGEEIDVESYPKAAAANKCPKTQMRGREGNAARMFQAEWGPSGSRYRELPWSRALHGSSGGNISSVPATGVECGLRETRNSFLTRVSCLMTEFDRQNQTSGHMLPQNNQDVPCMVATQRKPP